MKNFKVTKAPVKSIKLISHFKKESGQEWQSEFKKSFHEDDVELVSGTCSNVRPIGEIPAAVIVPPAAVIVPPAPGNVIQEAPMQETPVAATSEPGDVPETTRDIPLKTNKYSDVSDAENEDSEPEKDEESERETESGDDSDETVKCVRETQVESERYWEHVNNFLTINEDFLRKKTERKLMLVRKLRKYNKKLTKISNTIKDLEKQIKFAAKFPKNEMH